MVSGLGLGVGLVYGWKSDLHSNRQTERRGVAGFSRRVLDSLAEVGEGSAEEAGDPEPATLGVRLQLLLLLGRHEERDLNEPRAAAVAPHGAPLGGLAAASGVVHGAVV